MVFSTVRKFQLCLLANSLPSCWAKPRSWRICWSAEPMTDDGRTIPKRSQAFWMVVRSDMEARRKRYHELLVDARIQADPKAAAENIMRGNNLIQQLLRKRKAKPSPPPQ